MRQPTIFLYLMNAVIAGQPGDWVEIGTKLVVDFRANPDRFLLMELADLLNQASPRSRHWLPDAVKNKRDYASDDLSEAADDFVRENGKHSTRLANQILTALGEEPIFCE